MYVYKSDLGTSGKEVQSAAETMHSDWVTAFADQEARNVPVNLNPDIRSEMFEAKAGSSPRSSLGAGWEMGA